MLAILFTMSVAATQVSGTDCLSYGSSSVVVGRLSRDAVPGPPGYKSIADGDRRESYFVLQPAAPICIREGKNQDGLEPAATALNIELGVTDAATFRSLSGMVGRSVSCKGRIASSLVGHHLIASDSILWAPQCQVVPINSFKPTAGVGPVINNRSRPAAA